LGLRSRRAVYRWRAAEERESRCYRRRSLRLSRTNRVKSHISAILYSKGGRFVISDLLFESRGYYYTLDQL